MNNSWSWEDDFIHNNQAELDKITAIATDMMRLLERHNLTNKLTTKRAQQWCADRTNLLSARQKAEKQQKIAAERAAKRKAERAAKRAKLIESLTPEEIRLLRIKV